MAMIVFVVIMGVLTYMQTDELQKQTKYLYDHPYQVRGALGKLRADILIIHREMKNLFISEDQIELVKTLEHIDVTKADAFDQIETLEKQYLGHKAEIVTINMEFIIWNAMREETIRLLRAGQFQQAASRTKEDGIAGSKVEHLLNSIQEISEFENNKGLSFYLNSVELEKSLNKQLLIIVTLILIFTILLFYWVTQNIKKPILLISNAARSIQKGKFDARSNYELKNEFGELSDTFNAMAESIQENIRLNENTTALTEIMLSEEEAKSFFQKVLFSLASLTGSQMAAVYLLSKDKTKLCYAHSIGMNDLAHQTFSIERFEGEFGVSLSTHQVNHIKNLDKDTKFVFNTVSGTFIPREIITIPIIAGGVTEAVISLATVGAFNKQALQLIDKNLATLTSRILGILFYSKMKELSEILEQKNKELEQQKNELFKASAYNRGLIEASLDPLVTFSPDGIISDVNKSTEDYTGYNRQDLIGTKVSNYFSMPERVEEGYKKVLREGFVRDYELELKHKSGKLVPVIYNASVYYDNTGRIAGVFAAARDISEIKSAMEKLNFLNDEIKQRAEKLSLANNELEAQKNELSTQSAELAEQNTELEMQKKQLDEANKLKSVFLSNMSHELRTPLNSVIALSGVLSRKLKGKVNEVDYSYLDIITKNGKNLLNLINEILDLSRIEAGKEECIYSKFSIFELVSELTTMIQPSADEKNLEILNRIPQDFALVTSDRQKVKHILQNLISNAVKFTDKGSIVVYLLKTTDYIGIAVKDTGIGIAADLIPVIFDEFRQADEKTARLYGGSGLGLAIAKKYSELLDGYIEVNAIPNKGSTFTLFLPLYNSKVDEVETLSTFQGENRDEKSFMALKNKNELRILIVEDSEAQIIQLSEMLLSEGYQVDIAKEGQEALQKIRVLMPDSIILDLMMPGMDGFEILKNIREEFDFKVPIIVLTAKHISKEELSILKGNNISQLVQKGELNRSELLSKIEAMMPDKNRKKQVVQSENVIKKAGDPTILLVEDNPDNSLTIKALLGDKYFLLLAEDGITGLEKARNFKPHLILLDISLPGIDGFEVLKGIRETESIKNVPVVAVTARAMKGDKEMLLDFGFDAYIPKPVDDVLLEKTINRLLNHGK
jgi:PAS domain S-box-containing protein